MISFDADCWGGHKNLPLLSSHHPKALGEVTQGEVFFAAVSEYSL